MLKQVERFRNFLGEGRFWMLIGIIITTGIASLALAIIDYEQTTTIQTVLALAGIIGAALVIGSKLSWEGRRYWASILAPALGIVVIGMLFFPQYLLAALGAAAGWVVAGIMIFGRSNAPMQYRDAIKAMRKNDFKAAVATLDDLIKVEPEDPNHYRLRGRVLRLWGKTGRARRDYEAMIEYSTHDGIKAEAYNELSELELQAKNYDAALTAANQAAELLPNDWVAAYNLGMIQDRLKQSDNVIASLNRALDIKVKDARHRMLIHLWLVRANVRLGQIDEAAATLQNLKAESKSLSEWNKMLEVEEAAALRDVLGADVDLAGKLINDEIALADIDKAKAMVS